MPIESCLVDTNILLRMTRRADPEHEIVDRALARLAKEASVLCFAQQNIAELWNVMTRPTTRNGLGLTTAEAESEVRAIELVMRLLPETEGAYREWRRIVLEHSVRGVQVHDARLVAVMHVHNVRHVLTLNVADFSRFSDIKVLHPGAF
jgi:predicted nucleic acid-binding protein